MLLSCDFKLPDGTTAIAENLKVLRKDLKFTETLQLPITQKIDLHPTTQPVRMYFGLTVRTVRTNSKWRSDCQSERHLLDLIGYIIAGFQAINIKIPIHIHMQVGVVATFIITKFLCLCLLLRYCRLVYVNNFRVVKLVFFLAVVEAVADTDFSYIVIYVWYTSNQCLLV